MKLESVDDRVQVLDSQSDVWSVIRKIAESGVQEDAFYICDVGDIVRKHIHWRNLMPRVETHYAVKCNDSRIVLEVLAALGTGFDCASKEEIKKVMALGVSQERIIFANPTKPVSHIQHAQQFGVDLMTFDNKMELKKIKELYPNAKMVIRIKYDDTKAKYSFGKKFGCDAITEAPELLKTARSLGINVVGVSFHIGSGGKGNAAVYMGAIAAARHVFDVAADLGYKLQLLDIGGGYPGEHGTSITEIANCVNTAIELYFPDPSVKIIAEPGRYYVSSAFTLATNIHSTREVDIDTPLKIKQQMYYVNAGVYGALISTVFEDKYIPQPLIIRPESKYFSSIVWGPTCDGYDLLAENVILPEMQIGDWIIFEDAGAYTLSISCEFNGFPSPMVHAVIDENSWMLLKDILPMSDALFVMGNTPDNLRTGLVVERSEDDYIFPRNLAIKV